MVYFIKKYFVCKFSQNLLASLLIIYYYYFVHFELNILGVLTKYLWVSQKTRCGTNQGTKLDSWIGTLV